MVFKESSRLALKTDRWQISLHGGCLLQTLIAYHDPETTTFALNKENCGDPNFVYVAGTHFVFPSLTKKGNLPNICPDSMSDTNFLTALKTKIKERM